MKIVIDTSAILAVLLEEPEKEQLVKLTIGATLISPSSLSLEIGNALSNLLKRDMITLKQAQIVLNSFSKIPIQMVEIDLFHSLEIAHHSKIYAYDAYMISCALEHKCSLLTLDQKMKEIAIKMKCKIIEVIL
jgi:predicted nucleic acid-binding protein